MGASLTERRRVSDEGLRVVKLFSGGEKPKGVIYPKNKHGLSCASSRGKTNRANVIRNHWA